MMRRFYVFLILVLFLAVPLLTYAQVPGAQSGLEPQYPIETKNRNIASLYVTYQGLLEEIYHSVTRTSAGITNADAQRWKAITGYVRGYIIHWQSEAVLDLPVTHGRGWTLEAPIPLRCEFKDNIGTCDLQAMVVDMRDELALSASSKRPMHLDPFDLARQQSYLDAIDRFIDWLVANQPLDEPIQHAEKLLGLTPGEVEPRP